MKFKPLIFYCLFFVAMCICLSYFLFPGKRVAQKIEFVLEGQKSISNVSIKEAILEFPYSVLLENVAMNFENNQVYKPSDVKFRPDLVSLIRRDKKINFSGGIFDGQTSGTVVFSSFLDPHVKAFELDASGIKIKNFTHNTGQANLDMSMSLGGNYSSSKEGASTITGQGQITIKEMTVIMKKSLFNRLGFPKLVFSSIEIQFAQEKNKVIVSKCSAKGTVLNFKINGNITLNPRLENSVVDLKGYLLPDSPYFSRFGYLSNVRKKVKNISKQGIPFKIRGTIKQPELGL